MNWLKESDNAGDVPVHVHVAVKDHVNVDSDVNVTIPRFGERPRSGTNGVVRQKKDAPTAGLRDRCGFSTTREGALEAHRERSDVPSPNVAVDFDVNGDLDGDDLL